MEDKHPQSHISRVDNDMVTAGVAMQETIAQMVMI